MGSSNPKAPPHVCMTSTNSALLAESFPFVNMLITNPGNAGSKPKIVFIYLFVCA